jgi:signal transduction histidine kinase
MDKDQPSVGAPAGGVNAAAEAPWDALADVTRVLCAGGSWAEALAAITRFAVAEGGSGRAAVFVRRAGKPNLVVEAAAGFDDTADRARLLEHGRRLAAWVEKTKTALHVSGGADPRFPEAPEAGETAAYPLPGSPGVLGALVVFDCGPAVESKLLVAAHLAAVLLDRQRADARLRELLQHLDACEKRLVVIERLAALGESVTASHRELKAPLAGMSGLAARVAETLETEDPRRSMLEMIVEESARLDRVLEDQIEAARSPEPALAPDDVNRLVSEALALLSADLEGGHVRVTRRLGASLPMLLLDPDLMRRMILNLLRIGLESAGPGGRVKVETKRRGEVVELLVAADGKREPGAALENLWRPFQTDGSGKDVSAAGIERILREHRGMLRVFTTADWPLVFSLVLPISGNQDRRRGFRDRRRAA